MKKILIPIGALLVSGVSHAQLSNTENYVYTKTYLDYNGTTAAKTSETVQYFDGLGRPKQVVNVKASPTGKDVVTHIEYDGFGRQVKDYLPVPQQGTQNGGIYTSPLSNATQPTLYGPEKIFSEKILESSPLDRILQQKQVGTAWNDKPVQFGYDANIQGDYVRKYETSTTWIEGRTQTSVQLLQYFLPNQLYKNTVTDEDGNQTIEFKNGEGQTILVRKVISPTENADTYYVYNEYNQLAFVIPPLASAPTVESTTVENLYYQYRYDGRNRLVEKKLPGKGWEFMVYNNADKLIMTQDANMRASSSWTFTKYDKFGNVAYTGISTTSLSRQSLQTNANANNNVYETRQSTPFTLSGMAVHYSKVATPVNVGKILSVNYYDTYPAYTFTPSFPTNILGQSTLSETPTAEGLSTKSFPVLSLVKNIEDDNWTKNYTYYDKKGRAIGSYSINHLGGRTQTESKLDFAGVVQQSITRHKRLDTDTDKVITENFTYDSQNRLLTHTHQVDSNPVEYLAQNTYNELSQLSGKKVGGTSTSVPLQDVSYTYNIRGWMTKVNDPNNLNGKLFGYVLQYSSPQNTAVTGKYNGNITEADWRTSTDNTLRRYNYQYDALNRLTKGSYFEPNASVPANGFYNEEISYDINGNISNLKRFAKPSSGTIAEKIDDLIYNYENSGFSNRLSKITLPSGVANNSSGYNALGNTIGYDDNGNMTSQLDKGISGIQYNFLNLPKTILASQGNTSYIYRAEGTKVKKTYGTKIVDYIDGFQYENGVLKFFPTATGYFDFIKNKYIYNYTDHLGNVRVSYFHNGTGIEVLEENNYYPFGLKHEGYNALAGNSAYQYKYNGKELQETGMYDYGARFYMPDIGRWGVVDPLAETSRRWSVYTYAYNNPIRFIDPDGMQNEEANRNFSNMEADVSKEVRRDMRRWTPLDWYQKNGTNNVEWKDTDKEIAGYTHLGRNHTLGSSADGYNRMYYLHANGSATVKTGDSKTELFHAENGEMLSIIAGGTITTSATSVSGMATQVSLNWAFGGGLNLTFGFVKDSYGDSSFYYSIGGNLGIGAGMSLDFIPITTTDPNQKFHVSDFGGYGNSYNLGVGPVSASLGGSTNEKNLSPSQNFNSNEWGKNRNGYTTKSGSYGIGAEAGFMWTRSKTTLIGR